MELRAHDIVVVAREYGDAVPALPVPDAHSLVVRGGEDPGVLVVEEGGADVVQVAQQGEDAPALLVVPHLDLVVVTPAHEQRLLLVKVNPSHGPVMLVKLV